MYLMFHKPLKSLMCCWHYSQTHTNTFTHANKIVFEHCAANNTSFERPSLHFHFNAFSEKKINKWRLYILKASSWILNPLLIFHPSCYFPVFASLCSLSEDIKVLRKPAKILTGVVFETRTLETDAPQRNLSTTSQITCVNVIIPTHLQVSCSPRDPVLGPRAERWRLKGLCLLLVGFFIY